MKRSNIIVTEMFRIFPVALVPISNSHISILALLNAPGSDMYRTAKLPGHYSDKRHQPPPHPPPAFRRPACFNLVAGTGNLQNSAFSLHSSIFR
jgi:hypothetical protein